MSSLCPDPLPAFLADFEFEELDRFEIKGRGTAIVVKNPRHPVLYDPVDLNGKEINISGKLYRVRAVETFAIIRSLQHPYTRDFSVLVYDD